MNIFKYPRTRLAFWLVVSLAVTSAAQAQTSYFTNTAGGDWNVAANWDRDFLGENVIPAEATNANISLIGAAVVDYNTPMAATSFGALTVDSGATLNINAAGFNQDLGGVGTAPLTLGSGIVNVGAAGVWTATNGGALTVNLGGDLNIAGNAYIAPIAATAPLLVSLGGSVDVTTGGTLTFADGASSTILGALSVTDGSLVLSNCTSLTLSPGGAINVTNGTILQTASPSGSIALGVNNNNTTTLFTMYGGNVTFDRVLDIRGRKTGFILNGGTLNANGGTLLRESNTDDINRLVVNGGTANLGATEINRTASGGGLILSNGVVNATSLRVGVNNSTAYATIYGGALTNTGLFTISDRTNAANSGERRARLLIRGGTVVSTGGSGIIVANQANLLVGGGANTLAGILDINAGTIIAEGITLVKDNTLTNAHAQMTLSGSGAIYLGSVGLNANVGPINSSYSLTLSGGTLGAKADFTANANGTLSGIFTVQAADPANNPFNIVNSATWSGSGSLRKTGGGALTLTANNTFSGVTTIDGGSLVLSGSGALANSPSVTLASGTTFDFSAATASYTLAPSRTLAGFGNVVGNFTNASGSTINPGSNTVAGTLTFTGSLNQSGGAINHFDLPTTPGPGNDRINITGDLNVSGVNTIEVVGGGSAGTVHTLFQYSGSFNGTLANFALSGASGSLSNNVATKTIALIIATAIRTPTNVVWLGNVTSNDWDSVNLTNWLHAGNSSLTYFVAGDNALFDDTGIANNNVNLVGNNAPATLTVGAAGNYTFGGAGAISGATTSLTKTNTGTLTINTVNSYAGPTTISGGVVEVATLANGGNNSSIGSGSVDPANLTIDAATLRYTGGTVGINRGATINAGGATLDVSTPGAVLTVSGSLTGAGILTKSGAGTLAVNNANVYTGGTVINSGTLQAGNNGAFGDGGMTNNAANLRVQGALTLSSIIEWNGNTALELSGVGGGNAALRGAWVGSGTVNVHFITASVGQTFTIGGAGLGGGHMWDFSGTVDFNTNSGFLRINNDNTTFNFGSSNATFNVGSGTGTLNQRNGATTTHFGALNGGPNTTLAGRGSTGSGGTTTYSIGGKNVDCIFQGAINNGSGTTAITKVGTAKLTLSGTGTHTGPTSVESGTLQIDGSYGNSAVTVLSSATLQGNGTLGGTVDIQFGGILSPGTSIGQMTMTGSLNLQSGSTNIMEINKSLGTNDSVVGLASVSYSGTLVVNNLGGTLAEFDTFKLFDAASYAGAYEALELPALGADLFWDTSKLTVNGTISVIRLRPAISEFGMDGGNLFLTGTNGGNASTHYIIVTSTDVTTPLASWTPVVTNAFDGGGNFAFTNAVNAAELKRFYNVKTP